MICRTADFGEKGLFFHKEGSTKGSRLSAWPNCPLTDKAALVVVVCKSGHRGGIAMTYLNFLGYTNVRNLDGGMNAWITAELPVVK